MEALRGSTVHQIPLRFLFPMWEIGATGTPNPGLVQRVMAHTEVPV